MMDARELRIGNLVQYDGLHYVVSSIVEPKELEPTHRVWFENSSLAKLVRDIKPIPITPEQLEMLGFTERNGSWYYHIYFRMRINVIGVAVEVMLDNHYWGMVEYVHTLQNLFFALTHKELKIQSQ